MHIPPLLLLIHPRFAQIAFFSQGEFEGAKPASNQTECRAKPCRARRALRKAHIFVPLCGTKITAFFRLSGKAAGFFRQPEGRDMHFAYPALAVFPVQFSIMLAANRAASSAMWGSFTRLPRSLAVSSRQKWGGRKKDLFMFSAEISCRASRSPPE